MTDNHGRGHRIAPGVVIEVVGPRRFRVVTAGGDAMECGEAVIRVLSFAVETITAELAAEWLDLPVARATALFDQLLAAGVVTNEDGPGKPTGPPMPWRWWGNAALMHHNAARRTRFLSSGPQVAQQKLSVLEEPQPASRAANRGNPYVQDLPDRREQLNGFSLLDALERRRTSPPGPATACSLADITTALSETFRVRGTVNTDYGPLPLKAYPTAGARHDLDAYCIWFGAPEERPAPAAFVFDDQANQLRHLPEVSAQRHTWETIVADQGYAASFTGLVVIVSDTRRLAWKYRSPRAYTDIYQHTGHATQVLQTVSQALGLRTGLTNAFDIDAVQRTLGLTLAEIPTFVIALAKSDQADEAMARHRT